MYVTPAQLADRPGARELAQVATPEASAIVADDLMDATLRGKDRSVWPPDQVAVADAALARIQQAIDDAGALIDSFLGGRYTLPLASVPSVLVTWARAISRYYLHQDRLSSEQDDPIVRDYRDTLKLLQLVAAGKLTLGVGDPAQADPPGGDVQFVPGRKVFGRDGLGRRP